jgi:hypothetical protein
MALLKLLEGACRIMSTMAEMSCIRGGNFSLIWTAILKSVRKEFASDELKDSLAKKILTVLVRYIATRKLALLYARRSKEQGIYALKIQNVGLIFSVWTMVYL